ncbi:transglutaminase domain-containing protein [candidate division WOR-3 bacterium]|nr:transglutaminase domain-containing protein [candidate division WOR-3 bacterium]
MTTITFFFCFALSGSILSPEILENAGKKSHLIESTVNLIEDGIKKEKALELIAILGTIDLLEFDSALFMKNLDHSLPYLTEKSIPDSIFLKYLLDYRILYEPPSLYKPLLKDFFWNISFESPIMTACSLNSWSDRHIKEEPMSLLGPGRSVLRIFESREATKMEKIIFIAAALRSLGFPSRLVFLPSGTKSFEPCEWIEIFDGSSWVPFYPWAADLSGDFSLPGREHGVSIVYAFGAAGFEILTEKYAHCGTFVINHIHLKDGETDYSLNLFCNGSLKPLDYFDFPGEEDEYFEASLGEGDYIFVAGCRDEEGSSSVEMFSFSVKNGEKTEITPSAPEFLFSIPRKLPESVFAILADLGLETPCAVISGEKGSEPTLRMLAGIFEDCPEILIYGQDSEIFLCLESESLKNLWDPPLEYPAVICLDSCAEKSIVFEGYDPGIGKKVRKWMLSLEEETR